MKIKKFSGTYDYKKVNFVDADAIGVIEYGSITIEIDDEEIYFTFEERSDGGVKILLDDLDQKPLLVALKLEFDGEVITGPDEFLYDCYEFYGKKTGEKR